MSVDAAPDVSRETSAPETSGDAVLERLERLEEMVAELLTDSRAARPLLEKYVRLGGGSAPWARAGKRGRS